MCGWNKDTGDIIIVKDNNNDPRNIITEYGCLTTRTLEADADSWVDQETRKAQNNHMMVECMMASITEACFYKISNEDAKYKQKGVKVASLLFKLLMAKAIVDTRATTYQLRHNLSNLDNYMSTVNSNIEIFNVYVKNSVEGLKARGEKVDDLVMQLFHGYKAAADSKFVEYMDTKEEKYLDGDEMHSETIMQLALNKYTMRKDKGEWGAPTDEQNQLTALSSEVTKLQENNKKLISTLSKAKKQRGKAPSKRSANDQKWAWKKVPPSDQQPKEKKVEGRTYHWCTNHQAWTLHKGSECKFKPMAMENTNAEDSVNETEEDKDSSTRPSYSQALKTLLTVIEDSDSEEE